MNNKCVIVHASARDHYELSKGLAASGNLYRLVTDLYCPDILKRILPALAAKRSAAQLSSKLVTLSPIALWYELRMIMAKNFSFNQEKDRALGKHAAVMAQKKKLHIFSYSYYAADAFALEATFSKQKKMLFQLHPHPVTIKKLLEKELKNVPAASDSLLYENELQYNDQYIGQLADEPRQADGIVVASNYTAGTLIENGIPESKIKVIPYGISTDRFIKRTSRPPGKGLKAIFIGSMVQRKGLSYLLEAIHLLNDEDIELVICGRGFTDDRLLDKYKHKQITVKKNLSYNLLLQEMYSSDVFIFPTLCEGFAHVILEAMATGLPVITTNRCCGPDIIEEGKHGFIVPANDSKELATRIAWAAANKEALYNMGQAAAEQSAEFTWDQFRKKINEFYQSTINN